MTFTSEQKQSLAAPLNGANVKTREQGRSTLSYVESWHVIAEANRIFDFDGWTRETISNVCVSERERKIGKGQYEKEGWGVTYIAKVRVTVDGIVREGTGAGHGIDADLGLAHESAAKESESDAMKRALMTFGNPFGLALYDKTQANVVDEPAPKPSIKPVEAPKTFNSYLTSITSAKDVKALGEAWTEINQNKASMRPEDVTALAEAKDAKKNELLKTPTFDHLPQPTQEAINNLRTG